MVELSEHEQSLIVDTLESWLDEHAHYREIAHLKAEYLEYEQLARKLGWKPRSEQDWSS